MYSTLVLACLLGECLCLEHLRGWGYDNIHCRDNDDKPVDWWYLYKPPSDLSAYLETGRNFSYITPDSQGKWQQSHVFITAWSMFQRTLSPAYKRTYLDHMAAVSYDFREPSDYLSGTAASGILMADELGGLWLGHTLPTLNTLEINSKPTFPVEEIENGHLMMCLSLDLATLDKVATYLKYILPNFNYVRIPDSMKPLLPAWKFDYVLKTLFKNIQKSVEFQTVDNTTVSLLIRPPGDTESLYTKFAKMKKIVLDVYGQTDKKVLSSVCSHDYSVRNIDLISLKKAERVQYIKNKIDKTRFAISTAAHWQRTGAVPQQYWTCTSNLDKEDQTGLGGLLLCLNSYSIWVKFDNFKVKEPEC